MLKTTLNEILRAVKPMTKDVETRMQIINELRHVVSSIESLNGASVEPFGSFLSQLFSRSGDLDISIELPNGSHIEVPTRQDKQMLLKEVKKASRSTGNFRRLQFISHARIPILKLESKFENINCDVSINNLSGYMKSKFLLWISLIDHRFYDMVLLVKEWAKANAINNPRDRSLNSYSLTLLVIFHFQTCNPPLLPPLKDLYPGNMEDELTGVRADMERHIEEIVVGNIAKFRKQRRVNLSNLSDLFVSFHGKFSEIDTRAREQGICTFSGQWEIISTNTRWHSKLYPLYIEDPFEQPVNTARAVTHSQLTKIGEAFRNTYTLVTDPTQIRNFIIPFLAQHETFRLLPGSPFAFPISDHNLGVHPSSPLSNDRPRMQNQNTVESKPALQWPAQQRAQPVRPPWSQKLNPNNIVSQEVWWQKQGGDYNHGGSQSQNCFQETGHYGEPRSVGPRLTVNPLLPRDRPAWSQSLNPNNVVASKLAFKASPAEAEEVWWQKQVVDQCN